jgi:hypothetical protein
LGVKLFLEKTAVPAPAMEFAGERPTAVNIKLKKLWKEKIYISHAGIL